VRALPAERQDDPARRHLSGAELLQSVIALARSEFGALAPMVFREWGVRRSEDWGTIVFQLVEQGQLSARPEDRLDDLARGPPSDALWPGGLGRGRRAPRPPRRPRPPPADPESAS